MSTTPLSASIISFNHGVSSAWAGPNSPSILTWQTKNAVKASIRDNRGTEIGVPTNGSFSFDTQGSSNDFSFTLFATGLDGIVVSTIHEGPHAIFSAKNISDAILNGTLLSPTKTPVPVPTPVPGTAPVPAPSNSGSVIPKITSFSHNSGWAPSKLQWTSTDAISATLQDPNGNIISVNPNGSIDLTSNDGGGDFTLIVKSSSGQIDTRKDSIHAVFTPQQIAANGSGSTPTPIPTPTPVPIPQPTPTPVSISAAVKAKDAAMGPTFAALNPNAADTRKSLFFTPDIAATRKNSDGSLTTYLRANPYNVGVEDGNTSDFWSTSGQVGYIPDNPSIKAPDGTIIDNPGCDGIQTYAYYDGVFATSPRYDYASGAWTPTKFLGEQPTFRNCGLIIDSVRNYYQTSNEALAITSKGLLVILGTQTSDVGDRPWPYPQLQLPSNKIPSAIALSSCNEFAFITVHDTTTGKGQVAIIALEAKYIQFHTWPYLGLINQGVWSDFVLLGYIDLPFNYPTDVDAATNAHWSGPSQTNSMVLSQWTPQWISDDSYEWSGVIAKNGYIVVASKTEKQYSFIDLTPLTAYFRTSWTANFDATLAARAAKTWPATFDTNSAIVPKIVSTFTTSSPITCIIAGKFIDRWSCDRWKAHVATEDGTISIVDTSSLMNRWPWEIGGALGVMGTFQVGKNPVDMCFPRGGVYGVPIYPISNDGVNPNPADGLNNAFYVACRGDRRIDLAASYQGKGCVVSSITDPKLIDPVAVCTADRGPVLIVADFNGKQLVSFRTGSVTNKSGKTFPVANGTASVELSGIMTIPGYPYAINNANVN